MATNRSGWLGGELNDKPCVYGIPKDPEGDPRETKACGQPSVYKETGGPGTYCPEHAPEVAAKDESVYGPQEDEEKTVKEVEISVTPESIKANHHIAALFDDATNEILHLQVEETQRELEAGEGKYWDYITGKGLANFVALRCPGCFADGETDVLLTFTDGGAFKSWRV